MRIHSFLSESPAKLFVLTFTICNLIIIVQTVTVTIPLHLSKITYSDLESVSSDTLQEHDYNIKGRPGEGYFIKVLIGEPSQELNVLIDTGSSNFAIASVPDPLISNYFLANRSNTFQSKNVSIVVPYTMGSWRGYLASDKIQLGDLRSIQSDIACITYSEHFFINGSEWQGILGLAYADIARPYNLTVPFFDALVKDEIVSNMFSLQLCGQQGEGVSAGTLVLGGADRQRHTDQIRYTPLRRAWYFEVVLTGFGVGQETMDIDCTELNNDKTIVDSGTTNLRLPTPVFVKLVAMLNSQIKLDQAIPDEFWSGANFMCWKHDSDLLKNFPELRLSLVHLLNSTFTLVITAKQYLRPVSDVKENTENNTCYKFAVTKSETGTVIGAVIMEGFYVVFDRQNRRVGFAKSVCSPLDYNKEFGPEIEGPFPHPNPWACAFTAQPNKTLQIVSFVLSGLAAVFALPLLVMVVQWAMQKWKHRKLSRLVESSSVIGD